MPKKIFTIFAIFTLFCCAIISACTSKKPDASDSLGDNQSQVCVLNELKISLAVGEVFTLQVLGNDLQKDVEWISSRENVATVNNGEVVGLEPGNTRITAQVDGQILFCDVSVEFVYETVVYVTFENEMESDKGIQLSLLKGSSYTLSPCLIDGVKIENVSFTLTSNNTALVVKDTTIYANEFVENASVIVSCEYEGMIYQAIVLVTVAE